MANIPPSMIRQPQPPPPRQPLAPAALKEGKITPEMVECNNCSTHTSYPRSSERKRLTDIESLPDEVLFEVLVRLEAQDIYDSARLVCSKWYHMIHTHTFIYAHLQRSTYGLLFQSMWGDDSFFIYVGESGEVEISENRYSKLTYPGVSSCNGLLLDFKRQIDYKYDAIYVSNPATRQIISLPHFDDSKINYCYYGIAYAAASMEYKAVVLFCPHEDKKTMFFILTIGVDNSWRTVGSECESLQTKEFFDAPLITEGFVHWYISYTNEVFTMDIETEIITETSGPTHRVVYGNQRKIYLSTGIYLSLLIPCGKFSWEVWEMKPKIDYRWRKVWDISLEDHKCSVIQRNRFNQFEYLIPIGWLKYLEVLVFVVDNRCWGDFFMVGGNNRSTHTYFLRSCKRKSLMDIDSLPDELLFDVLVRLPAHDIYDPARLVCRK
ncbi:hypothetical protein CASFOL_026486 [Castilleja foliolosa]|uniref:F-box domain-containing protein n=1 Tax=Castilleja foliolosa TaxID=1961234 RepID=A0ABD3CI90_9LAMI